MLNGIIYSNDGTYELTVSLLSNLYVGEDTDHLYIQNYFQDIYCEEDILQMEGLQRFRAIEQNYIREKKNKKVENALTIFRSIMQKYGEDTYWPLQTGENTVRSGQVSAYPYYPDGMPHYGLDIGPNNNAKGYPVYATENGTVHMISTGYENSSIINDHPDRKEKGLYGNRIQIKGDSGNYTLYAHLTSIYVREGESVIAGEIIGSIGTTGNSDGPHLHIGMATTDADYYGTGSINPWPFLHPNS